ncbi:ice-binding family protein [uncultured Pontibacter sp.]|uniref:ice-binding family protein n=1 Tax=uncultured Pontibacter sp. TaxID=453356 RepID=UPI00261F08B2|nr:ice-binding family protein [uncultured Pontibacter sp.]
MNKILLLLTLFLIASTTLSIAQSEPGLGKSSTFAVLGSSYVSNTGTSGVTGDLGLTANGVFTDNGALLVKGTKTIGLPLAAEALQDARAVYDYWINASALPFTDEGLKRNGGFPGVYHSNGDVNLDGIIALDGRGDVNSTFIFIIDGDLNTPSPNPPTPGTGLLLQNGAQPKNIFWIVKGKVKLGSSTSFQGTIISGGDITLESGVNLIGRAISLNGGVSLNTNNIFLPNIIIADLNVKKVADKKEYKIGDEVTYTITVSNTGSGKATRVVVYEITPANLEFVRVESASAGTYDSDRHEWVIDELSLNETAELRITFKILAAGQILNKVTVGSNNPDPNPGDNEDEDPIEVPVVAADLSVVKTASGAPYKVGGTVTYTIVTTNNGPYPAQNVVVNEVLPSTLALQSFTVSQGAFDSETGIYTIGTLASGATATLELTAKILGSGKILNTVTATTSTNDPKPGNNTDTEEIEVTCTAPTLAISGDEAQCAGAADVTYTVTAVEDATYDFELTGGLTEVSRTANSITVAIGNASGKVIARVTDLCGNVYTVEKEVNITTAPPAPSIAGNTNVCANSNNIVYTAEGLGDDATYEWVATGDVEIVGANDGKTVTVNSGANGGTLTVKGSNKCFTSAATTVTITTKTPVGAPGNISGPSAACANTTLTYTIAEVGGATGYTWSIPQGWTIESGQGTSTLTVKAGTNSGDVTVAAKDDCGTSAAAVFAVSIKNTPQEPIAINGSNGSCLGAVLTYSVSGTSSATGYTWTVPQGWKIRSGQGSSTIEVEVGNSAGQITVAGTNECGAGATAAIDVAPAPVSATPGTIEGPEATCANTTNLTYSIAVLTGADTYTWAVPAGWTIVSGQGTQSITVNAGASGGEVSVTATNSCGTSAPSKLNVTVTTPPTAPATIKDASSLCNGLMYTVDAVPGATGYTWTVPAGFTIVSGQGTATVSVKRDAPNARGEVSVVANTGTCAGPATSLLIDESLIAGDLEFPKAFSPNGDGKNDTWVIANLMKYAKNEVVIFNRWGSEVYKKGNYQNDWNGNKLEPGTYFYRVSVTMCDGADKVFTGYVTIFR